MAARFEDWLSSGSQTEATFVTSVFASAIVPAARRTRAEKGNGGDGRPSSAMTCTVKKPMEFHQAEIALMAKREQPVDLEEAMALTKAAKLVLLEREPFAIAHVNVRAAHDAPRARCRA